jgi:hypothetical protein
VANNSKRAILERRLMELLGNHPEEWVVDERLAGELRAQVATGGSTLSDRKWRDLLRGCGRALAPLVEGVRQDDFKQLERTLLGLWQEWRLGDRETRTRVRRLVIEAKDHAKWVVRNPKVDSGKREVKEEMVLWMLTWLENPDVFEPWVALRKAQLETAAELTAVRSTGPE